MPEQNDLQAKTPNTHWLLTLNYEYVSNMLLNSSQEIFPYFQSHSNCGGLFKKQNVVLIYLT